MGTTNSTRLLVATTAVALMGWSARAGAQAEERDQWRFVATPYVWLTALDGTVGLGPVRANADLSATDVFRMLKFGVMGAGEGRKGPWVIGADAIYAKLGTGMTVAVLGDTGSLEFTMRETILQSTGGYALGDSTLGVDFLVGMRYWNLANTLDVDRTRRPSNERSMTQQWVDGTGGFRFRWVPYEKLRLAAAGDVGGGGSRETWQASSSIGYDAWSKWTFGVAYRILSVNYDRNNFLFDTDTKGFVLGATWRSP
jgi:hypothetical protein